MTPLLGELRQGDLVGNVEALTRSAAQAAADIHRLQGEVRFDILSIASPAALRRMICSLLSPVPPKPQYCAGCDTRARIPKRCVLLSAAISRRLVVQQ